MPQTQKRTFPEALDSCSFSINLEANPPAITLVFSTIAFCLTATGVSAIFITPIEEIARHTGSNLHGALSAGIFLTTSLLAARNLGIAAQEHTNQEHTNIQTNSNAAGQHARDAANHASYAGAAAGFAVHASEDVVKNFREILQPDILTTLPTKIIFTVLLTSLVALAWNTARSFKAMTKTSKTDYTPT